MSPIDEGRSQSQLATLEAIDATLAGEPVDPMHAEMAELALLLSDDRPRISPDFAASLDRAVERRFVPARDEQPSVGRRARRRWWLWTPAAGLAVAVIVAIVVVAAGGSGRPAVTNAPTLSAKLPRELTAPSAAPRRTSTTAGSSAASTPGASSSAASGASSQAASGASSSAGSAPSSSAASSAPSQAAGGLALQPPANGRKVIQGAQLTLNTGPAHVDVVAQEVFDVVGQFRGIVSSSNVTATSGPGGWAQFQLRIPSSALPQAMASLSTLRYAHVASRTDTTQDVNGQYESDVRALADARALRTSLLKQLAGATTQAQIDSLTARIHDAEASISSDLAALRGLNRQIDYSQVGVTINGGGVVPTPVRSGGFGLRQAAHDAGRVLTLAAGITLIVLAAMVPLGLLAALIWWIVSAGRRRRREHALDLV